MEAAQSTFISSTFWTERIGPTAALKTLEVMEQERSWEKITEIGLKIRGLWIDIAKKYGLEISITGMPAIQSYAFKSKNNLKYKTLVTQEMLKKGFLSTPLLFSSTAHNEDVIKIYIDALDECFALVKQCEEGVSADSLLEGRVCHNGFKRLN